MNTVGYTGQRRLTTILAKNRVEPRDFLNGASDVEALAQQDRVGLHQPTLRKVDVVARIAVHAFDRALKTHATW